MRKDAPKVGRGRKSKQGEMYGNMIRPMQHRLRKELRTRNDMPLMCHDKKKKKKKKEIDRDMRKQTRDNREERAKRHTPGGQDCTSGQSG